MTPSVRTRISTTAGCCAAILTLVGACGSRSYEPVAPAASALRGTTQVAVLVGYDAKTRLLAFSPAVLYVGSNGKGTYEPVAGASTYTFPLSSDPTVLIGTTPCSIEQFADSLTTHPRTADPIAARLAIDPRGEITKITEVTAPGS
ncbi:hypothetical protein ABIA31_007608 [Catenulispora sp. MAP5-51]|uniref:hypothetical protein n=1 Tax=Catenulispora sp. MAP5-51 TaxID=3156298 RepID=UPI0035196CFB